VTNTFPLQSILDLSQMKLEEATRRLGELITGEQQAAQRLELLAQYRDEYHARFLAAAQDGLSRDQWRNYQLFLDKLDTAISQAREMVAQSHQLTAAGQQEWLAKRGRVKAFDTLAQRHQARIDYAETRREQKALDEHSSRKYASRTNEDQ
jgi:flagellar FliJ protein